MEVVHLVFTIFIAFRLLHQVFFRVKLDGRYKATNSLPFTGVTPLNNPPIDFCALLSKSTLHF